MAKKKAIKLAAASAVAASAFVAAAPAQTDAASNVATEVSKAVTQMKKAYHTYSDTVTATGKFAEITAVYKEYNAAKDAYKNAVALVNKAGGADKDAQLAELETTYDTYIKQRVVTYIDAYNYITKYVEDAQTALEAGVEAKNLADVEEAYHAISYELKDRTAIIYRVYGKTTRDLFQQYKDDAQDLRDAYQNDVTVAMKTREVEEALEAGDLEKAAAAVEQINKYLPDVTETFKAELTTSAEAAVEAYEAAVVPAVESVSAVNTKTIAVTFDNAVKNTTDAAFEIKKGASTLTADVSWNEDQTVAYLELAGKISAGTYTVNVTGLSEEALTGSFEAQNEKVAEIKVLSDIFVKTGTKTATAGYQVLNQYGEDITKSSLASTVSFTSPQGAINSTSTKGVLAFTASATEIKAGDKVAVVGIDSATGTSVTSNLTVAAEAVVDTITLGDLYNAQGKELSEDTKNLAHYVLIDAKDQYGNAVTNASTVESALTKVSSNSSVATFGAVTTIEINDKDVLAVPVSVSKAGSTTLTVVSNLSGKTATKTLDVAPGVKVDSVVLGTPETDLLGATTGALIPVELTNTLGEKITKASDVKNVSLNVTGDGADSPANAEIVAKDGELFVSFDTASHSSTTPKNVVVSLTTPTNKTVTQVYQVKADAVATELVGIDSDVSLSVLQGESLEILESKFIVNDQYGNRIKDASKYDITIDLVDPSSTNGISVSQDVDANSKEVVKITAAANAKADNVVFTLAAHDAADAVGADIVDANGNTSTIEKKVAVVAASEFVSYEANQDLGTIYEATSHAKEVTVYGVTATGKKVALPSDYYNIIGEKELSATPSGTVITVDGTGSSAVASPTSGQVDTVDAGFKVVINSTGQVIEFTGKVTAVAPKATTLSLVDPSKNNAALTTVKDIDNDGDIDAADLNALTQKLIAKDQYGVAFTFTFDATPATDVKLLFTNLVDNGTKGAKIVDNGLESAAIKFFGEDDTANVKLTVGAATLDASVAPTVAFAPDFASENVALAVGTSVGETKVTVTGTVSGADYYYAIGASAEDRLIAGSTFAAGTTYTSLTTAGTDIAATAGEVITLVSVDAAGKVIGYKTISVPAEKIKAS